MAAIQISALSASEILDSRGRPTLSVTIRLADGTTATAGVPSGASTGSQEAVELRDGDQARYLGAGVLTAVRNVTDPLAQALVGRSFGSLAEVDDELRRVDGSANKSRLGANALVGVSMAACRAMASSAKIPLWQAFSSVGAPPKLPVPHFNVINGGAHAPNALEFQEFMLAPLGAPSLAEAVRAGAEIYATLKRLLAAADHATGLGDEGGFAPELTRPEEALTVLVRAISDAGYTPGRDGVAIAMDPAASEFGDGNGYRVAGQTLSSGEMIDFYEQMITDFPIWSIEDGLAEGDAAGWVAITERLGGRIQLVGDDNFVTNPRIITEAIAGHVANAALIKLNQIGTVTETLEAMRICREAGYAAMVSHRSGETDDSFIADLAVGSGCGQIKAGAPARGERVAKYNRLLAIAEQHPELSFGI